MLELNRCHCMDALTGLKQLEEGSINCVVTSPPYYGLRDYGIPPSIWPEISYIPMAGLPSITVPDWTGCLGLEQIPQMFIAHAVLLFREVWRVLRDDGTLWMNMGDSYATNSGAQPPTNTRNKFGHTEKRIPAGYKQKDLMGIPWMLAFALRADGWYLRQDIIWEKPNPMPESVRDRCTKAHEYIFLLSKSPRYYFDADAIKEPCVQDEMANGFRGGAYCNNKTFENSDGGSRENHGNLKQRKPAGWDTRKGSHGSFHRDGRAQNVEYTTIKSGNVARKYGEERDRPGSHLGASIPWEGNTRNKRDVWTVSTRPFKEAHFATFPPELIKPCILAGCPEGGTVCDPFMGSGTTLVTANELDRNCIGFDVKPDYCEMANRRRAEALAQQSFFRKEVKES